MPEIDLHPPVIGHRTDRLTAPGDVTAWCRALPKVELHLHLEGAIPHDTLWELIRKYGGDRAVTDRTALADRFRYRDFAHFIEVFIWKNGFLREPDDFSLMAEAVARALAGQRVRYAEAFFSPTDFRATGLLPQQIAAAIRTGLDRVPEVEVTLVADLVRDTGPAQAAITLAQVAEVRELGVAGIGIGGSEHAFPPEPFAPVYDRARELGLRTTAHAGEAAGAGSVRAALDVLRVERIGHGTRAGEDPGLLERLAEARVPLEMCPISNLRTGVVDRIEEHPVLRYARQGLLVTVNTDDPEMFQTDLATEYATLIHRLGASPDEVRALVLNAVEASWLPPGRKRALRAELTADPDWTTAPG